MPKPPKFQRGRLDIKRGEVAAWPSDAATADSVASRVSYQPNGKHKAYASPEGRWTYIRSSASKCDKIPEEAWPMLTELLRTAIEKECVSRNFRGGFPARAWAYLNGKLHEARLDNQGMGTYHAFPLEYEEQFPRDPDNLLSDAPRMDIDGCEPCFPT